MIVSDTFEGGSNREAELPVYLYVQDVNDNKPIFQNTPYHIDVDEVCRFSSHFPIPCEYEGYTNNCIIEKYSLFETSYSLTLLIQLNPGIAKKITRASNIRSAFTYPTKPILLFQKL